MNESIDEQIEDFLKEESAQGKAVASLIEVKDRKRGAIGSEIELKTDLNQKQICIHTQADMINHILGMNSEEFMKTPFLSKLTEIKERKQLSKDRKSRKEIVDVARNPDFNTINTGENQGFAKRMFTPRQR